MINKSASYLIENDFSILCLKSGSKTENFFDKRDTIFVKINKLGSSYARCPLGPTCHPIVTPLFQGLLTLQVFELQLCFIFENNSLH